MVFYVISDKVAGLLRDSFSILLEEPFSGLAGHSGEDDRVVGGFGYGAHLIAELRLFSEAQKLPNSRAERPYALRRLLMVSGPTMPWALRYTSNARSMLPFSTRESPIAFPQRGQTAGSSTKDVSSPRTGSVPLLFEMVAVTSVSQCGQYVSMVVGISEFTPFHSELG
jgi:hypothetical protein